MNRNRFAVLGSLASAAALVSCGPAGDAIGGNRADLKVAASNLTTDAGAGRQAGISPSGGGVALRGFGGRPLVVNTLGPPGEGAAGAVAPTQSFTVPPNVQAGIAIQTTRYAVCGLRSADGTDYTEGRAMFADDEGIVSMQVMPDPRSTAPTAFRLECRDDSKAVAIYPVELNVKSGAILRAHVRSKPYENSIVRPPLADDPLSLSQDEVVLRGYPPRPDPTAAPERYKAWLQRVSRPVTMVFPRFSVVPRRNLSFVSSGNWSGFINLAEPNKRFTSISAEWHVPTLRTNPPPPQFSSSSLWVGIDGYNGLNDIIQDGTEHYEIYMFGTYYAFYDTWVEYFPADEMLAQVNVFPGDLIYELCWPSNSDGTINPFGSYATFYTENETSGVGYYATLQAPPGTVYHGETAEWIAERPSYGGVVAPLADYGTASMSGIFANSQGNWQNLDQSTYQMWMINGNGYLLSSALKAGSSGLNFKWYGFQ